jgi:hypothetical protein
MSTPIATCWMTYDVDWPSIEPPSVGDPCDRAVGGVDDGGWVLIGGRPHLLVIDCDLVRMSIGDKVNIGYDYG